jgi:hypothetical protein
MVPLKTCTNPEYEGGFGTRREKLEGRDLERGEECRMALTVL